MAKMLLELLLGVSKWRAEMGDRCHVWGIPVLHMGRDGQWSEPASPAIRESYWGRHTLDLEVRISEIENKLYCPCWSPWLQLGLSPTQTSCHISQQSPSCNSFYVCLTHTPLHTLLVLPAATFTTTCFLNFPTPFPLPIELLASKPWVQGRKEKDQCTSPATRKHIQEVTLEKVMKKQIVKQPKRDRGNQSTHNYHWVVSKTMLFHTVLMWP